MIDAPDAAAAAAAGEAAFSARVTAWSSATSPPPPAPLAPWAALAADTRALAALAAARRAARFAAGALRLDNTKLVFRLDEGGAPVEAWAHVHREANQMIEEFMLLANMCAAARLHARLPAHALLRRHPPPAQRQLDELATTVAAATGWELDVGSAGALQRSLADARAAFVAADGAGGGDRAAALTLMCTKPMQVAAYVCAGTVGVKKRGAGGGDADDRAAAVASPPSSPATAHYALAVDLYTHFTSPIRRYPDVLVHRMLAATLAADGFCVDDAAAPPRPPVPASALAAAGVPDPDAVAAAAAHCNERKAAAKKVQDASGRLFLVALVRATPRAAVAVVTAVGGASYVDAHVPSLGVDVRISVDDEAHGGGVGGAWDGEGRVLTVRRGGGREGGGGGGAADAHGGGAPPAPLPRLHNPDRLAPVPLPLSLALLTPVPVVVTAREGGGREPGGGELTASLLVDGSRWAAAAAAGGGAGEAATVVAGGRLGVVDDLLGAD